MAIWSVLERIFYMCLRGGCNGCSHHQIKQILLEIFIEVLLDELNKLEHKNNDKIEYIDKIGNKLPESRRFTSKN